MEKIDLEKMRALARDRYLNIQEHPDTGLLLFNYTPQTQYERFWTPETLISRGLITDLQGNIIARPFPKFFNLDEHEGSLPGGGIEVSEKMDGSLGILYFAHGLPHVATRGSFKSKQSDKANEILRNRYSTVSFRPEITYLFEIIYPENRIVVDYGSKEDLILLAMIETRTGREIPLEEIGFPLVKRYDGITQIESLREIQEENREGFVIRFENGLRLKLKFEEYVRLHRIITGVNERTLWQLLSEQSDLSAMLDQVPDEFYQWVKRTVARLQSEFHQIEALCQREFKILETRKESAAYFLSECTYPPILFKMMDGKPYQDIIWKIIKPEPLGPGGRLEEDFAEL